jgi:hypothetical protein
VRERAARPELEKRKNFWNKACARFPKLMDFKEKKLTGR